MVAAVKDAGREGSFAGTVVAHLRHSSLYADRVPAFDPQAMITRFRVRAEAVRTRGMPPIEGPERKRFREQAQRDYTDYAMIGDAEVELVDGILTLRIDLRPPEAPGRTALGADVRPAGTGRSPGATVPGSAAVVHAGVLHAEDLGLRRLPADLGDLPDDQRVAPELLGAGALRVHAR